LAACGHECVVVAPSLITRRPGDRIKTDRRDAINLAKLHRAGELTAVWVPDHAHEAIRDLVRARLAEVCGLRQARQQLSGFLLRHGHHYHGPDWTQMHRRWLQVFSAEGEWFAIWPDFYQPMDIFQDVAGRLYVTDKVPRLTMLAPDGTLLVRCRPVLNGAHGMWGDGAGSLYMAEMNPSRVTKLTPVP
jgi:hypothetical protein